MSWLHPQSWWSQDNSFYNAINMGIWSCLQNTIMYKDQERVTFVLKLQLLMQSFKNLLSKPQPHPLSDQKGNMVSQDFLI